MVSIIRNIRVLRQEISHLMDFTLNEISHLMVPFFPPLIKEARHSVESDCDGRSLCKLKTAAVWNEKFANQSKNCIEILRAQMIMSVFLLCHL